jgi:hypothetical protein
MANKLEAVSGGRWRPIVEAVDIVACEDEYHGPVLLSKAIMDGMIQLLGKHCDGRSITNTKSIPVPEIQDYLIVGIFGPTLIPGGPILIRDGAPLPESLFPPSPRLSTKSRPMKSFAYTDYWIELLYDHQEFNSWRAGEARPQRPSSLAVVTESIGDVQSSTAPRRVGRTKGSGTYAEQDAPLLAEMHGLLSPKADGSPPSLVSPEAAARAVAHKAYGSSTIESKTERLAKAYRKKRDT